MRLLVAIGLFLGICSAAKAGEVSVTGAYIGWGGHGETNMHHVAMLVRLDDPAHPRDLSLAALFQRTFLVHKNSKLRSKRVQQFALLQCRQRLQPHA